MTFRDHRSRPTVCKSPARRIGGAAIAMLALLAQLAWAATDGQLVADRGATSAAQLILRLRADARPVYGQGISSAQLADLERYLGVALAGASATVAGNQVLELAQPVSAGTAKQLVNALRMRGDVVWAEVERGAGTSSARTKATVATGAGPPVVRQLIVTFADAQLAQASRRNEKLTLNHDALLSNSAGFPLHIKRATVGGAWVVELLAAVDIATAEAIAARLEDSGIVRLAAPDYPVRPMLAPNDPTYAHGAQWSLQDVASTGYVGIDATRAWDVTTGSAGMVIAVIDSGIVTHPELAGRVLPGYDFIGDITSANDGDGRDADATDPGDWRTAGLCPSPFGTAEDSSWHGTLVAGILAANSNNGTGIAGIDWNAHILPLRALGRCGGKFSDILDAMTWAAGLPVPGTPANPHPAKVINLSVGGSGSCVPQIQALVDAVVDAGVFVAAAAGNDNKDAAGYVPASCGGLSTVAATDRLGARASYSNFSMYLDLAAPGGDVSRNGQDDSIVSTWNDGKTNAGTPIYGQGDGTSFATPHVAGVAALMLAVNPGLLPAQIKALMAQTVSPFAPGSDCVTQNICGAGIVNAFGAVKAAQAVLNQPVVTPVVEFYNASQDHYYITAAVQEINDLDNGVHVGWKRTGSTFNAYAATTPGFAPVCRFYIPPANGDSHFYSASTVECAQTAAKFPFFDYEGPNVFYIALPDIATGACPSGTAPVYRVWDNRVDSNHRYVTSLTVRATMVAARWIAEGYGPNQVIMCAPT